MTTGLYVRVLTLMLLMLLVTASIGAVDAKLSPKQIAQIATSSVVLVSMEDNNGQPISIGSGFCVKDNIIATNYHVVESSKKGYVNIVGQKQKYEIEGIVGIDEIHDIVLLSIKGLKAPALVIGDNKIVVVGDEIYTVGNPLGFEGSFTNGLISSVRKIDDNFIFQMTAPISPGSSGGPVLNDMGQVIGIAVAAIQQGQNLNFAIPSYYLYVLLKNIQPVIPLLNTSKDRKQSYISVFNTDNESVIGTTLLWEQLSFNALAFHCPVNFSFSIQNKLHSDITDVYCLIIFYDQDANPIDTALVICKDVVVAGLGKRVKGKVNDESVYQLCYDTQLYTTRCQIRILDFRYIDEK